MVKLMSALAEPVFRVHAPQSSMVFRPLFRQAIVTSSSSIGNCRRTGPATANGVLGFLDGVSTGQCYLEVPVKLPLQTVVRIPIRATNRRVFTLGFASQKTA